MLDVVTRNWPLKLLSVALAFAIWIAVTGEESILRDFNVPLDITLNEEHTLASSPPTTVTVRLRGSENRLTGLNPVAMSFGVDLTDAIPGERTVELTPTNLEGLPRGFDVELIAPVRLSVVVDELLQKDLPVNAMLTGQPPQGYAYYSARVVPRTITVEGPRTEIETLEAIRTDPINLEGRTAPFIVRVGAAATSPAIRVTGARSLEVRIDVDTAPVEAVIESVPIVISGQVYEATASPETVEVTLFGPPTLLENIGPDRIRAVADVAGLEPRIKAYRITPRIELLDLPPRDLARITVKSVSRETVAVTVSDRRLST
jgi:YbbR domain-containing protein